MKDIIKIRIASAIVLFGIGSLIVCADEIDDQIAQLAKETQALCDAVDRIPPPTVTQPASQPQCTCKYYGGEISILDVHPEPVPGYGGAPSGRIDNPNCPVHHPKTAQ